MNEPLLKVKEAAAVLNASPRTIYRLVKANKLPVVRLPHCGVRFRPADLEALIERNTTHAHNPEGAGQASTQETESCQDSAQQAVNPGNGTRTASTKGTTRRSGGVPTPTPTAKRLAEVLAFDEKTIRARKEQRRLGRNGS